MKKSVLIITIISLAISACTTQKQATSFVNDDVYNSSSKQEQQRPATTQQSNAGAQIITSPDNTTVQKPASSTFEDDYNDYSYSSRIDRFNSKDTTRGYFDDSYSGSSSKDNIGSNDPNVNVYLGVGAGFGGYYGSSISFGMGWGYPYSNWGWDYGWGYPYSGWGWNYGWGYPYYGGYNTWYNPWYNPCCYCYGYNDWYYGGYPPYYASNTYYGSRKSLYRTDGGENTLNSRNSANLSGGTVNSNSRNAVIPAYSRNSVDPSSRNIQPSGRSVAASKEQYRYTRSANNKQPNYQRSTAQNQGTPRSQQRAPRYVRPENISNAQRSGSAQSYSSPAYRQPKSSQEYLTPRSQNPGASRIDNQNTGNRSNPGTFGTGTRQYTSPSNENRKYTTPVRSGSSGNYNPTRTNSNYTAPTRSGSSGSHTAPVRSGSSGSYSAPSNSSGSGSYSAPSRSGGSGGGGAPSGGSSGGGGGRRR
jgi:hypothetical protein